MWRWLGLWVALMLALAGCRSGNTEQPDVAVTLAVTPQPPRVGLATVVVALADRDGERIAGATVKLEGNMSHAGMVPVFADAKEVAPGRYEASLEFTMGGDWFILVHVTLPDGRELEHRVDVPGVKSP